MMLSSWMLAEERTDSEFQIFFWSQTYLNNPHYEIKIP